MGDKGAECLIMPQYLNKDLEVLKEVKEQQPNQIRGNEDKKPKSKGKKGRPPPMKFSRADKLCPTLNNVQEGSEGVKCTFPNCAFQHDPEKYLSNKPKDAGAKMDNGWSYH